MTAAAPTFGDLADPAAIHHRLLAAVADLVLGTHARSLGIQVAWATSGDEFVGAGDAPLAVGPAAALADAFVEAEAAYSRAARRLGSDPGATAEYYRAAASRAYEYAAEIVPSIVGARIAEARQAAGLTYG